MEPATSAAMVQVELGDDDKVESGAATLTNQVANKEAAALYDRLLEVVQLKNMIINGMSDGHAPHERALLAKEPGIRRRLVDLGVDFGEEEPMYSPSAADDPISAGLAWIGSWFSIWSNTVDLGYGGAGAVQQPAAAVPAAAGPAPPAAPFAKEIAALEAKLERAKMLACLVANEFDTVEDLTPKQRALLNSEGSLREKLRVAREKASQGKELVELL